MSSDVFHFKHFDVRHERSSMRVGTDGVLLGAWAGLQPLSNSPEGENTNRLPSGRSGGGRLYILDIGTGCGLIALMLAQRFPEAHITGIDIDLPSVEEARENVLNAPFHDRIEILHQSLDSYTQHPKSFTLIVSNPPFYEEDTMGYSDSRNKARHTASLSFEQLIECVDNLLSIDGEFDVIIPYSAAEHFIGLAAIHNLYLARRCNIKGGETRPFKRCLLAFNRHPDNNLHTSLTSLTLNDSHGHRSAEYQQLTHDFYLN